MEARDGQWCCTSRVPTLRQNPALRLEGYSVRVRGQIVRPLSVLKRANLDEFRVHQSLQSGVADSEPCHEHHGDG